MSVHNPKMIYLSFLMKQKDAPFKQMDVVEATGLSRQLIAYHTNRFVDQGILEQTGRVIRVRDIDSLVDTVMNDNRKVNYTLHTTHLFKSNMVERLYNLCELTILSRALNLKNNNEFRVAVLEEIENTIENLTRARRKINTTFPDPRTARRKVHKKGFAETRDEYKGYTIDMFEMNVMAEDLEESLSEAMEETE